MSHGCEHAGMSSYMRMMDIKLNHCCGHSHNSCGSIWAHGGFCGGTSFWSGAGAGLAYGLVNWAMSGLTNWIGGMGFGGMGWGNVGFGGGNWGFWGLNGADGSRSTKGDYYSHRYGSSDRTSGSEGADGADGKINDIDNAKIADITGKIVKLKTGAVSDIDYNTIKQQIEVAKGATDKINEDHDKKTYDNLLNLLDEKKNGIVTPEGATVKIGKNVYFVSQLKPDQVTLLTKEEIDEVLSGDNDVEIAKAILREAGALDHQGELKATTNFALLYLAEKAGIKIKCAHNIAFDGVDGTLPYIHGKISNVTITDNGVMNDVITFTVTDDNGTYDFTCAANGSQYTLKKVTSDRYSLNKEATYSLTDYAIRSDNEAAANKKPAFGA